MKGAHLVYEICQCLTVGSSTVAQLERSSAGVAGWAGYANIIESYNDQKLMGLIKDCQSSDVAEDIRKAHAKCQKLLKHTGITDIIEERCSSRSAMPSARSSLSFLPVSSLQLCETADADGLEINMNEDWCDVEFEVGLDSGSKDHVCDEADTPGYVLESSPGSSRGQFFIVGNGGRLPNMGQNILNIEPESDGSTSLKSCFQIARATRPLMSACEICDSGMKVEFADTKAIVKAPQGSKVCAFERKPGRLYIYKMRLKQLFPWQGSVAGSRFRLLVP